MAKPKTEGQRIMSRRKHWSNDPYWTEALDQFCELRDKKGKTDFTLNLAAIERAAFDVEGPAYKLMDAMVSVKRHEGLEGFRGAPRVLLALLVHLEELSSSGSKDKRK